LATLRAADAKERYLLPVLKRVRPYLGCLFPGAHILINDNFNISKVVRQAGARRTFAI
jgi:hypothetical protein